MHKPLSGLILLLPTLLWFAAQVAMVTMLPSVANAGLVGPGTTLVICTGSGTQTITIDENGNPVKSGEVADCPLCGQISGDAPLAQPHLRLVAVVQVRTRLPASFARISPRSVALQRRYETRAPPTFPSL